MGSIASYKLIRIFRIKWMRLALNGAQDGSVLLKYS